MDKDTVSPDMAPYVKRSAGAKLPQLYLVDAKGTVYFEGALPATIADLESLVAKYRTKAKEGAK